MIEILLHGLKMDPLVSLHYFAPVCALINVACIPFTEGLAPFKDLARIGPLILISNAGVAFLLNIASVVAVGVGSGLVLTLAGVLKVSELCDMLVKCLSRVFQDILLIMGSVVIFGSLIAPIQILGKWHSLNTLVCIQPRLSSDRLPLT
jgi:hypothetical protein